tara:strand:- start:438 stop:578 length:141 start_codon:yes stop_codon:yes gene_type:complete
MMENTSLVALRMALDQSMFGSGMGRHMVPKPTLRTMVDIRLVSVWQ